jgi:hypothetical protein
MDLPSEDLEAEDGDDDEDMEVDGEAGTQRTHQRQRKTRQAVAKLSKVDILHIVEDVEKTGNLDSLQSLTVVDLRSVVKAFSLYSPKSASKDALLVLLANAKQANTLTRPRLNPTPKSTLTFIPEKIGMLDIVLLLILHMDSACRKFKRQVCYNPSRRIVCLIQPRCCFSSVHWRRSKHVRERRPAIFFV